MDEHVRRAADGGIVVRGGGGEAVIAGHDVRKIGRRRGFRRGINQAGLHRAVAVAGVDRAGRRVEVDLAEDFPPGVEGLCRIIPGLAVGGHGVVHEVQLHEVHDLQAEAALFGLAPGSGHVAPAGKPCGIGLSVWRFNLGAGSEEQGDAAQIQPSTRTECFLKADGTYDWSKQAGQVRFLKLAKERGVPYLLAFLNSPPVHFTENGLATNTGRGGTLNLRPDCYDDFARFMVEAVDGLEREHGLHIDYVSPLNEPDGHWNWLGPKQEGTPATSREVARVARELDKEITRLGLSTKILVNESSDLRCLLGTHMTDWQRARELSSLFSPDSTDTYVGACKNVLPVIAGHSYWTNTPLDFMRSVRRALLGAADSLGVSFWQTEICPLWVCAPRS